MICRPKRDWWLLISQLAHSWVAGQLATAWGNEEFGPPTPREAVILATALHDIGWSEWDAAPRLRSDGRPVNFLETSLDETRQVWQRSVAYVGSLDPYAALLVSLHASTIYRRRQERGAAPPAEQGELQTLMEVGTATQAALQEQLKGHPLYGPAVEPDSLWANYRILRTCDMLSLALCTGPLGEGEIPEVPGRRPGEWTTLRYFPLNQNTLALAPYPFSEPRLTVGVEARQLEQAAYPSLSTYHAALGEAAWNRLEFTLIPAQ